MNALGQIEVYIVLTSGGMILTAWEDEFGHDYFEPKDAVEQCSQKVRAGEAVYGRSVGGEGPSETFRYFAVEPRSVEMVFANA